MKSINIKIFTLMHDEDLSDKIKKTYKMAIPHSVQISFSESTLEKMRRALTIIEGENFSKIKLYSNTKHELEKCHVDLLDDKNEIIKINSYKDFNRQFKTFDSSFFKIVTQKLYVDKFYVELIYVCGFSEFVFRTNNFSID